MSSSGISRKLSRAFDHEALFLNSQSIRRKSPQLLTKFLNQSYIIHRDPFSSSDYRDKENINPNSRLQFPQSLLSNPRKHQNNKIGKNRKSGKNGQSPAGQTSKRDPKNTAAHPPQSRFLMPKKFSKNASQRKIFPNLQTESSQPENGQNLSLKDFIGGS